MANNPQNWSNCTHFERNLVVNWFANVFVCDNSYSTRQNLLFQLCLENTGRKLKAHWKSDRNWLALSKIVLNRGMEHNSSSSSFFLLLFCCNFVYMRITYGMGGRASGALAGRPLGSLVGNILKRIEFCLWLLIQYLTFMGAWGWYSLYAEFLRFIRLLRNWWNMKMALVSSSREIDYFLVSFDYLVSKTELKLKYRKWELYQKTWLLQTIKCTRVYFSSIIIKEDGHFQSENIA